MCFSYNTDQSVAEWHVHQVHRCFLDHVPVCDVFPQVTTVPAPVSSHRSGNPKYPTSRSAHQQQRQRKLIPQITRYLRHNYTLPQKKRIAAAVALSSSPSFFSEITALLFSSVIPLPHVVLALFFRGYTNYSPKEKSVILHNTTSQPFRGG